MDSRAKVAGHPVHPMLIVFPLGLLTSALAFDVIQKVTDDARYGDTAFRLAFVGLVGAIFAAFAGLVDYFALPAFTRAKRVAALHGLANLAMLVLFVIATVIRGGRDDHLATGVVLALEAVAIGISVYAGWLGGELVERLGIGIEQEAIDLDTDASLETGVTMTEEKPVDHPRGVPAADVRGRALLPVGTVESHTKVAGHATHPMLVVFPLGLLSAAVIFDVFRLATDDLRWADAAFHTIAAGVVMGLVAAVPGLLDYLHVPSGTRARSVGLLHAVGNVCVLAVFGVSWLVRLGLDDHVPGAVGQTLAFVGIALATVTGWLGGELHTRLGVGVDPGAYVDAPSSLSTRVIDLREPTDVDVSSRLRH